MNQSSSRSFQSDQDANSNIIGRDMYVQILDESGISSVHEFEQDQEEETTHLQGQDNLSPDRLHAIHYEFNKKLLKFIPLLHTKTNTKIQEQMLIKQALNTIKISCEQISQNLAQQEYYRKLLEDEEISRKDLVMHQVRNNQHEQKLIRHLENGKPLEFLIHDSTITPFYLSHNQVHIYLELDDVEAFHPVLDLVHQFLRHPQILEIDTKFSIQSRVQDEVIEALHVSSDHGKIDFVIKSGFAFRDFDRLKMGIMQVYCELCPELKQMCTWMNYWAHRRGFLNENAMPEFALYCQIIDFFQINNLVPNIFHQYYCPWSQDKYALAQSIRHPSDNRLLSFKNHEYMIYRAKGEKVTYKHIQWLSFPRPEHIGEVKRKWQKKLDKTGGKVQQLNLGSLIAQFFYIWNQDFKYQQPLCISEIKAYKITEEIGIQILNPILPDQVLTPLLRKRKHNEQFISNNAYFKVRSEYERAYKLISESRFKELCDEQPHFI